MQHHLQGASGSGKSTTCQHIFRGLKGVRVLNEKEGEETGYLPVTWDGLEGLENCSLLADDMMKLKDTNYAKLEYLLSYTARHKNVSPVVVVAHTLLKNNVFGLIAHVDQIWFTFSKCNVQSLGIVCTEFKFSRAQRTAMVDTLLDTRETYGYYVLDVEHRTFLRGETTDSSRPKQQQQQDKSPTEAAAAIRKTAEVYVPLFCCEPKKSLLICEYIAARIPLGCLNSDDLTLSLRRTVSGEEVRLSLLDYLHSLNSTEKPSGDISALHRYISKYVELPRCFVSNKHLRRA
jgi:hypothetical protein